MTFILGIISISDGVFSEECLDCPGLLDQLVRLAGRVPRDGGVHARGHQAGPAPARGHAPPHRAPLKARPPSNRSGYKELINIYRRQIRILKFPTLSKALFTLQ